MERQMAYVKVKSASGNIYVMHAGRAAAQRRVTQKGNYNPEPDWSPRGGVIASSGRDERFTSTSHRRSADQRDSNG